MIPITQSFSAIVIGGGPGGLCAAIALRRIGVQTSLYERSSEFSQGGAAISFSPNAMWCLDSLELGESIRKISHRIETFGGRDYQNSFLFSLNLREHLKTVADDRPYLVLKRSFAHTLLLDAAKEYGVVPLMNKKFLRYEQDNNGVVAYFEDGSTAAADFLIGADGINSLVRDQLALSRYPALVKPLYVGYGVWRGIARNYIWPGPKNMHMIVTGPYGTGTRLFFADMGEGCYYWFYCKLLPEGGYDVDYEDRKNLLVKEMVDDGWDRGFYEIIQHTDSAEIDRRDICEIPQPLPTWSDGRVALLGDACHAMTPENGQGAAMAIEDAKCLADSINQFADTVTSKSDFLKIVFENYEKNRKNHCYDVAARARKNGWMLSFQNTVLCWVRSQAMYYLGEKILKTQTYIWAHKQ